jgi:hypothetical protein
MSLPESNLEALKTRARPQICKMARRRSFTRLFAEPRAHRDRRIRSRRCGRKRK